MKLKNYVSQMRRRTLVITGALILVIAAGSVYWFGFAMPASSSQAAQAPVTRTVQASLQTMEKSVSSTGTLSPTVQQTADFTVSGTVTAVNVTAGQTVTAGQVLATVDTMTVDAALLQAKATLATAEAKLADATSASDGSDADVAQIAADQSSVDLANTSVTDAQTDVTDATLTAPVAGLVTSVGVAVGDKISAGSSSSASSTSSGASTTGTGSTGGTSGAASGTSSTTSTTSTSGFTIVSTDSWQVSVDVSESDIANVAKDDQVELSLTGGTAFFGTVASVGLLPATTSGAVTYPVVVAVTGSPAGLYDGVSVTTAIVYERRTDVLTVPSEAVTTADGASTVTTLDAEGAEVKTTVVVGETVGALTEITSGLAEGDSVLVTVFTPGGTGGTGTGGTGTRGTGGTGTFPGGGTGTFPGGGTGTGGTGTGGTTTGTTRSTTRSGATNG